MEWKSFREEKPTKLNEKYLCYHIGEPHFSILYFTNHGKLDCYRFGKEETFYKYDSEYGFIEVDDVLFWMEIDKPDLYKSKKSINEELGILGE